MSQNIIPEEKIIKIFNEGCENFLSANTALDNRQVDIFSLKIGNAVNNIFKAWDFGMKTYLKRLEHINPNDRHEIEQHISFFRLKHIFNGYATPNVENHIDNRIGQLKNILRNAEEHNGSTPDYEPTKEAIEIIYVLIKTYIKSPLMNTLIDINEKSIKVIFGNYNQHIVDIFNEWNEIFVHIDGKEDSNIIELRRQMIFNNKVKEELIDNKAKNPRENSIDFLRKNSIPEKRMVILGEAGTGKTSTLKYLALSDAKNKKAKVPIYIAFRDLVDSSIHLEQYIYNEISRYSKISQSQFVSLLNKGRFNIFFDGLNEIINNQKEQRDRELKKFLMDYPNCFIIITCRKTDYNYDLKSPVFRLLEMRKDSQVIDFLHKNAFGEVMVISEIQSNILQNTQTSKNLRRIISVPMMFKILIGVVFFRLKDKERGLISENEPLIPSQTTLIIDEFIKGLYSWETEKNRNFDKNKANKILCNIGLHSFMKGQNATLNKKEIKIAINEVLTNESWLIDIDFYLKTICDLKILVLNGEYYSFFHQMYQEYFAEQSDIEFNL